MASHQFDLPLQPGDHDSKEPSSVSRDPSIADFSVRKVALDDLYDDDGTVDHVYQAKARVLNNAIQEIGMGKYQIYLFCCAGFGWFA